jgi:hypothetical protein
MMSLADTIGKIKQHQTETRQKFQQEFLSGLQQAYAYKKQEEVDAQREAERITGTTTTSEGGVTTKETFTVGGGDESARTDKIIKKDYETPTEKITSKAKAEITKSYIEKIGDATGKTIDEQRTALKDLEVTQTQSDYDLKLKYKEDILKLEQQYSKPKVEAMAKWYSDKGYNPNQYNDPYALMQWIKKNPKVDFGGIIDTTQEEMSDRIIEINEELKTAYEGVVIKGLKNEIQQLKKDLKIRKKYESYIKQEEETVEKKKTITRTGTTKDGRKVIQYSDGSIEYAE